MAEYLPNPPIPGLNPNANSSGPAEGVAILMIIVTVVLVGLGFLRRPLPSLLRFVYWRLLRVSCTLSTRNGWARISIKSPYPTSTFS